MRRFDRIGIVFFRSTTPWTRFSSLRMSSFSTVNSMTPPLGTRRDALWSTVCLGFERESHHTPPSLGPPRPLSGAHTLPCGRAFSGPNMRYARVGSFPQGDRHDNSCRSSQLHAIDPSLTASNRIIHDRYMFS